ncbi:MAG: transcription-repair coupling factor [Gammaproteobacteria bacterium]
MSATILQANFPLPTAPGASVRLGKAYGAAGAIAVAELIERAAREGRCVLILTGSVARAESLAAEVAFFRAGRPPASLFPDLETLPYDAFSPHQDLVSRRLGILRELPDGRSPALFAAAPSLLPRLPPRSYLVERGIRLAAGQQLDQESFRTQLEDAGYQRVSQVGLHGEYAVRGSLVDFFPTGHDAPLRVDFFDAEIETLREFDPDSQVSTGRIDAINTMPAREIPIDEASVTDFRRRYRQRFEGNPSRSLIYREVTERRLPGGVENYLPLFFAATSSLWDYLPGDSLVICYDDVGGPLDDAWRQALDRHEQACLDPDRPTLDPDELFWAPPHHHDALAERAVIHIDPFEIPGESLDDNTENLDVGAPPGMLISRRAAEPSARLREFLAARQGRVLFASESAGRRELLMDILRQENSAPTQVDGWREFVGSPASVGVSVAPLDKGVVMTAAAISIVTEFELFGDRPKRRRRHRRIRDPEALISDLTDLRPGAPVVHSEHGVGRYVGLTNLAFDDTPTEFVTLEYDGGDRLHVPVASLHLISRYTGAAPEQAPLHRLGSDQWAKTKRKAAEKIRDVAAELLDLYSQRAARTGFSYHVDPADIERFADGFPFAETEDQAKAIEDVLGDLVDASPMDRLVCGDVGFGKTEVALRAALVAVTNGRQVAVLVPTTLLAQQHYQTFVDRFADWPINVALLSRFQGQRASREVIESLENGRTDIVVGTHRLLQRSVAFKDLGLAVIDEEHRFGVRHKERLKSLRTEVDILTLTATPIPRTLNMALGSLRELSLIATPPESRLSIKTFVTQWNDALIREACQRELKRGGQVYFVHNRIEDIRKIADQVADLIPEARVEIAHGQMRERELERIMNDFYHRRFHVLVCTAIIESGLDVPSANTIVINRADRFGLAQLHQLRGRVGRSHHQAFAYLLAPAREALTADAAKRLEAIESLEDLGAGFVLATHDLEIRGAGELLGEGQSGQIQEIGFSLYNDMLSRTVQALRDGLEPDLEVGAQPGPEINLHVPALLPEDYLPDVHLRLVHYKRIASAADRRALDELQVELIDRFGLLPEAAKNLFRVTEIRLNAEPMGIRRLELSAHGGLVEFGPAATVDPAVLVQLLESEPDRYRLDRAQRLKVIDEVAEEDRFDYVTALLGRLGGDAANH